MTHITYEHLHMFCAKSDSLRPKLLHPALMGGRWYASNSRILISVPKDYVIEDERLYDGCKIEGRYPNVKSVINEENVRATKGVGISIIKAAFSKLPMVEEEVGQEIPINYIDCPCCDDGEIEINDNIHFKKHWISVEANVECPVCHGYGKIPDWDDYDPEEDDEGYDPDYDTTYVKKVKTGNMVPDYEHGTIVCDGVKCSAANLKIITDFFDSIGADEVNYEVGCDQITFECDNIYILQMGVYDEKNDGITAW